MRQFDRRFLYVALAAILTVSCGGGDSSGPETIRGAAYINPGLSLTAISPGYETTLRPAIIDSTGEIIPYHSPTVFSWTTTALNLATVSDHGVVKVLSSATPGQSFEVRICLESICTLTSFEILPRPDSITLVTQGRLVTIGGRNSLRGIGWIGGQPTGNFFFTFTASDPVALPIQPHGCGEAPKCVVNSADVTETYPASTGVVTVTAESQGLTTTGTMTIRTVQFIPSTLTTGGSHVCATATDGPRFCWGSSYADTPMGPSGPPQLQQVQAGAGQTCGIDAVGLVQCWVNDYNPVAAPVSTTLHFTTLAVGSQSSCGIDTNGATWCWGENESGQLGDSTMTPSSIPVQVIGGHLFVELDVYGAHACGRTAAGEVWCWGSNFQGELGSPDTPSGCSPLSCDLGPRLVTGGHVFTSLVVGSRHTCGIDSNGTAWCWGAVDKLGNGAVPPPNPTDPAQVSGNHVWTQLTAGSDHTCGISDTGQSFCWGANPDGRSGQLPDGSTLVVPTEILGSLSFTLLDAGGDKTCGVAAGVVYCFGGTPDKVPGQP